MLKKNLIKKVNSVRNSLPRYLKIKLSPSRSPHGIYVNLVHPRAVTLIRNSIYVMTFDQQFAWEILLHKLFFNIPRHISMYSYRVNYVEVEECL